MWQIQFKALAGFERIAFLKLKKSLILARPKTYRMFVTSSAV